MSHLIENILDKNFVVAEDHLYERLGAILEKKLYEKKRMVAADMDEAFGGQNPEELRKKGYRRAIDVLGLSPYDKSREEKKQRERQALARAKKEKSNAPKIDMSKEKKISEAAMTDQMAGKEDKFKEYNKKTMKSLQLKKDPRLRDTERYNRTLERFKSLKARGSRTADDRMHQITKGYAGTITKHFVKKVAKGTASKTAGAVGSLLSGLSGHGSIS